MLEQYSGWVAGVGWPDGLGGAVDREVLASVELLGQCTQANVTEGRADYTSGWGGGGHHYMVTIRNVFRCCQMSHNRAALPLVENHWPRGTWDYHTMWGRAREGYSW